MSALNVPDVDNPIIAPSEWKLAVECRDEEGFRFEQDIECDDRTICTVYDRDCVEVIRLAPAMAREIKRLEAENKRLGQAHDHIKMNWENWVNSYESLKLENQRLTEAFKNERVKNDDFYERAALSVVTVGRVDEEGVKYMAELADTFAKAMVAKREQFRQAQVAALGKSQTEPVSESSAQSTTINAGSATVTFLPTGCEPFDLERAKVEGARTAEGNVWKYAQRSTTTGRSIFHREGQPFIYIDDETGCEVGVRIKRICRLYCIAQRLPFDLAKALAGAPVVTRDGRPVTEIEKSKEGVTGLIKGKFRDYWDENGRYDGQCDCRADLFMEASV